MEDVQVGLGEWLKGRGLCLLQSIGDSLIGESVQPQLVEHVTHEFKDT